MKKNRLLSILLALMLAVSMVPASVYAEDMASEVSGNQELSEAEMRDIIAEKYERRDRVGLMAAAEPEVLAYDYDFQDSFAITETFDEAGEEMLIIEPVADKTVLDFRWYSEDTDWQSNVKHVVIGEGVTAIDSYSFFGFSELTKVELPDSLEKIGECAFEQCYCLNDINIPESVVTIEPGAFYECGSLPAELLPAGLDENARALAVYAISDDLENSLSLDAPAGTTYNDEILQSYHRVREILDSLDLDGKSQIEKIIDIYGWVTANVAYDYAGLNGTDEYEGIDTCYYGTAHSALFKHKAVCAGYFQLTKMMMNEAGIRCVPIESDDHVWEYLEVGGKWYAADSTWDAGMSLYEYPYFLRTRDSYIQMAQADPCYDPYDYGGHYWRQNSDTFNKVYPPGESDYGLKITGGIKVKRYLNEWVAQKYEGSASSLTIPGTIDGYPVTSIAPCAFEENLNLTSVTIGEGVQHIGEFAFYGCENLRTVTLPSTLQDVAFGAFWANDSLKTVKYNGTAADFQKIKIDPYSRINEFDVTCKDKKYLTPYNLQYAKISVSPSKLVCTGKVLKPTITVKDCYGKVLKEGRDYLVEYETNDKTDVALKNVNNYYVMIYGSTGAYFNYKDWSGYIKVVPKAPKITTIKAKKKGFYVKWSKVSTQATGYQIQYALNKKFTKGKKTVTVKSKDSVSKTISKLKGKKTYYVRVRTYKYVSYDIGKMYSSWSAVKKIKTK